MTNSYGVSPDAPSYDRDYDEAIPNKRRRRVAQY